MIDKFQGDHRFLSNFYPAKVLMDGDTYPTVEHAYQAAKTSLPEDRRLIRFLETPALAKKHGRRLKIRDDWNLVKHGIMEALVRQKFFNDDRLIAKLLATGDEELVEGNNWWDVYWGVCNGKGLNHLGKILMKVREELRRRA